LHRDRILIFSSNPGRVAAEIEIDLIHISNRFDTASESPWTISARA
jgi:hypothetical protein